MSLTSAQAAANQLRTALLDNGVRAVSIELQTGRVDSGWGVAPFKRGLGHHIVSRPPGTPGLALVKRGRADLPGPLCNGYGGYDLVARIICLGWANHPGAGGPWSVPGWGTVPEDEGRPYIFGWEFEGGIVAWTDEMHDFMARCGAGTLDWLGTLPGNPGPAPLECWGEHFTWAGPRKIDRLDYTTASGRARIAAVRGSNPPPEDDMPTTAEFVNALLTFPIEGSGNVRTALRDTRIIARRAEIAALANGAAIGKLIDVVASGDDVTADELRQAVAAGLTEAGVTRELIQEAVEAGMAADNAATADEIVDALVERLAGTNPAQ